MRSELSPPPARTNAVIAAIHTLIFLWASALPAKDGDPPAAATPPPALPGDDLRLIVLVVIDQFRGDSRSDILAGRLPDTDLAGRVRAAFHAERSPDVFLVPEPYWIPGTTAASHGTPHTYDAHVPLVIYGGGLKPARIRRAMSMTSVAPTLTAILGCSAPSGSKEKPLLEVLDGVKRKPYRK